MNYNKKALVFGATGQIGSYLCDYLLKLGYGDVVAVSRRTSIPIRENLVDSLGHPKFKIVQADITDVSSLYRLFNAEIQDKDINYEVYNLAAMSQVAVSFKQPILSAEVTGTGHLKILETLLPLHNSHFKIRTYFAGSSELYGKEKDLSGYQSDNTRFWPSSPYSAAKLLAFHLHRIYRESYGMWNTCGIVFNTESPRRGEEFVTRKITKWFGEFMAHNFSLQTKLSLGNIFSCRDWTHAKDTVKAIHLINTAQRPKDYIVASGQTHTILDFINECYHAASDIIGQPIYHTIDELYEVDDALLRPNEVPYLKGDAGKIREELGWKATISFKELVHEMIMSDYKKALNHAQSSCCV